MDAAAFRNALQSDNAMRESLIADVNSMGVIPALERAGLDTSQANLQQLGIDQTVLDRSNELNSRIGNSAALIL